MVLKAFKSKIKITQESCVIKFPGHKLHNKSVISFAIINNNNNNNKNKSKNCKKKNNKMKIKSAK